MRRSPLFHVREILAYYASTRPLSLRSAYSVTETRRRLLRLNEQKDVSVSFSRRGDLLMVATAHARARGGVAVIPVVRATITEDHGHAILEGQIGLDAGLRIFIAVFVGFLVFIAVVPVGEEAFPGAVILALAGVLALLVWAYSLGRHDFEVITRRLSEATSSGADLLR